MQSGGSSTISGDISIGAGSVYALSGSGSLSSRDEYLNANQSGFQQSGGTNTVAGNLIVGSGGRYLFSGGVLQLNGCLAMPAPSDAAGAAGAMVVAGSGTIDFSQGSLVNTQSMSVTVGANSLFIVPPGFSTTTGFASYQSLGITHTAGTTLVVGPGQGFADNGAINDPVVCQGSITTIPSGSISLTNGISLSGAASVVLGTSASSGTSDCGGQRVGHQRRVARGRRRIHRQERHRRLYAIGRQ